MLFVVLLRFFFPFSDFDQSKRAFQKQMKWSYLTPGTTLADQRYKGPCQQGGKITRVVS